MDRKSEIKKIVRDNGEALYYIYRDTVITYIKLMIVFPKQLHERKLFIRQMIEFKNSLIEEIKFLNYLISISNLVNEEEIDEILDDMDITFEQEYLYYDDIIDYMEKCIGNKELHFSNNFIKESVIIKKIKLYKNKLIDNKLK